MENLNNLFLASRLAGCSRYRGLNCLDKFHLGDPGDNAEVVAREDIGEGEWGEKIQGRCAGSRLVADGLCQGFAAVPHASQLSTRKNQHNP